MIEAQTTPRIVKSILFLISVGNEAVIVDGGRAL
jgi:hypothetical protein